MVLRAFSNLRLLNVLHYNISTPFQTYFLIPKNMEETNVSRVGGCGEKE